MAAANVFNPINQAVAVDGLPPIMPLLLEDLNMENIIAVISNQSWYDRNGVRQTVFEVLYDNPKKIYVESVLFLSGFQGATTTAQFLTYLNSLDGSTNYLTLYNSLKKVDIYKVLPNPLYDVILNDKKISRRYYDTDLSETWIYMGIKTNIDEKIFIVAGDQTLAGQYYYA